MTEWFASNWKRAVAIACLFAMLIGAGLGQLVARNAGASGREFGVGPSTGVSNKLQASVAFELPPSPLDAGATEVKSDNGVKGSANLDTVVVPGGVMEGNLVDRMWETNAQQAWQVRSQPLTPQNWYITGVVQRGTATQVIVQFDGEPTPKFFKIGETLPGGSKLAWVRPDAIGVVTPNKKKIDVPVLSNSARRESVQSGLPR